MMESKPQGLSYWNIYNVIKIINQKEVGHVAHGVKISTM